LIKKETRILGLGVPTGAFKQIPVVGVVFRGSLWLDGVISCKVPTDRPDGLTGLVQAIVRSRQHSQIRTVVLHGQDLSSRTRIDISDLSHKIDVPVISISRRPIHWNKRRPQTKRHTPKLKLDYFPVKTEEGILHVQVSGLSHEEVRQVFAVGCASGQRIPEALRVAEIVAKQAAKLGYLAKNT
jgi:endonuclease V-like protein UPF0215 family